MVYNCFLYIQTNDPIEREITSRVRMENIDLEIENHHFLNEMEAQ